MLFPPPSSSFSCSMREILSEKKIPYGPHELAE
jgi:hypothetical protein